jgi:hypothetical protein
MRWKVSIAEYVEPLRSPQPLASTAIARYLGIIKMILGINIGFRQAAVYWQVLPERVIGVIAVPV